MFKISHRNTTVRTNDWNRATERESKKVRGEMTSRVGMRWQRGREKAFQVSKCWCKCYFMFHKTGPTHLGWTSHTACRPAGLQRGLKPIGVALSTFCTGLFSPRSLAQAIIADQLCGPLWGPVNQGPPPYSGWIQAFTTSWEFQST